MPTTAERYRAYRGAPLFSMGFRPFFLFAALWAGLAVPIWLGAYLGWLPAVRFSRDWHVHEMLFGYLAAVIAGFLLTAVPNWTGRLPVTGRPLGGLFLLWLAGRAAMLAPASALGAAIDSLFLFALAFIVARELIAGRNLRNLPVAALICGLGAANALTHLRPLDPGLASLGERIGLAGVAMLVGLIGGRIVPSFTRNWMTKQKIEPLPAPTSRFDAGVLALNAAGLAAWAGMPLSPVSGALLLAAGLANFWRLSRWRGWTTAAEPLVLVLHLGYGWLALGLALLGLSVLAPQVAPSAAGIHALTAGAFGVMTLAVMTRASRGHTGRPLIADAATQAIYALVNLGAAIRVAAPWFPAAYAGLLIASALAWAGAFALFAAAYGPLLLRPRAAAQ